jgi:signal transduction histidine kinase
MDGTVSSEKKWASATGEGVSRETGVASANGKAPVDDVALRVLLVEDYTPHVQMVREMVAKAGVENWLIEVAGTLHDALERIVEHEPHVVLLDLLLPDSRGFETFAAVHSAGDFPIVVLTGLDDRLLAIQTVKHGAQDYLVKGRLDHHLVVRAVHYAIERFHIERELKAVRSDLERRVEERTAEFRKANDRLRSEVAHRQAAEATAREMNEQLSKALELLRNSRDRVVQRERLHALGLMASGIAHEFNNALAPILGFSELLLRKPTYDNDLAKTHEYLEMIHTAATDSAKIVSQLREFYRVKPDDVVMHSISLNAVVEQVVILTRPFWKDQAQSRGANIEVVADLDPGNPSIVADETDLRQMITNLVLNSIEAIPQSGWVRIATSCKGDRVILAVSDNGEGMEKEVAQRCLEPFFSTKSERGTGLGLSIAYGVVQRHGGQMEVRSTSGGGTTISASFPLQRKPAPVESTKPAALMIKPSRILVVEDEPLVRELIVVYLSEDKHSVVSACDGRDGLEKFQAGNFDLVLTDRAMPGLNGDQLAQKIKKLKPRQPVVLLTGFGELMPGEKLPDGIDAVVAKPFTMETLREAVSKHLPK